jgi:hypothetical protein
MENDGTNMVKPSVLRSLYVDNGSPSWMNEVKEFAGRLARMFSAISGGTTGQSDSPIWAVTQANEADRMAIPYIDYQGCSSVNDT